MSRIAVVGNVSRDIVDGSPPRPGGCPFFAAQAFAALGRQGELVTRCAERDLALFEGGLVNVGVPFTILPGERTAGFEIAYEGETRTMTVSELGDAWTAADAAHVSADATAVHVAPLLRGDFPAEAMAAFAAPERRVSLDAQGLVRKPQLGPLVQDAAFDRSVLAPVSVLKLSEEEAGIVAGGRFDASTADQLGVAEIVITLGSRGADVWVEAEVAHVRTTPVLDVEATGAGDAFMVAYLSARQDGASPVDAAGAGNALVAEMLRARKSAS